MNREGRVPPENRGPMTTTHHPPPPPSDDLRTPAGQMILAGILIGRDRLNARSVDEAA